MAKVKSNAETLVDDNGVELIVGYDYEQSGSDIKEFHGNHEVGCLVAVTLTSVEVVIAGKGVEILPMLTKKQVEFIEQSLNIE